MSAADRLAAAMNALAMATREQQEQRGLRERHVEEGKAAAMETLKRDAAVHARYIERMQELNKRQQKSGGWLTEKALADRDHRMSFGPEDDETAPADEFASYARPEPRHEAAPPPPPIAPSVPGQPEPAHGAVPEPPPSAEPASPAPRRTGRHARVESFDDDDFSNNSWLVD